jgi:predicted aspartyl protease
MALIPTLCALVASQQGAPPSSSVPFRIADRAIIVDAAVNGRNVSLMFDTGFGAAVDLSDNVNIGKPTGTMNLIDFVGSFEAQTVKIKTLKLGEKAIDTADMSEAVMSRENFSDSYGMHCDGIMGFEVIKNNVTGINYEHSRFDFYPKTMDISKWVPDNKRTFLAKLLPRGMSSCEMAVETPNGQRMVLALDTGNAFYATTHRDVLERVGLWDSATAPKFVSQSWVASGPVDSWELKLKNMKIFGVPVPQGVWDIIDLPSSTAEGDGTVGFGFLHNFNIIIDYDRRRVWLENYSGKTADDEIGEPGIAAYGNRKGDVQIFHVTPNSPAEKAGIKKGDVLLSIGGDDLDSHMGYSKLRKLLEGPVGSKIEVAVSSNGELKRLQLERTSLYNEPAKQP